MAALEFELLAGGDGEVAQASSFPPARLLIGCAGPSALPCYYDHLAPRRSRTAEASTLASLQQLGSSSSPGTSSSVAAAASNSALVVRDPSLDDVPVPTLFVGKLYCPIAAGSPTLTVQQLQASREQGVDPVPQPTPEEKAEVWRAAQYTDALSAYNILQGCRVEGRTAILVERGLAEQLARGRVQMAPVGPASSEGPAGQDAPHTGPGFPNPLGPLQRLIGGLREKREIMGSIRQAIEQLPSSLPRRKGDRTPSTGPGAVGAGVAGQQEQSAAKAPQEGRPTHAPVPAAGAGQQGTQQQFSLQRVLSPLGSMLPAPGSASPPQLAILPVRVAVQLLAGMPRRFLLLTDGDQGSNSTSSASTQRRRRGKRLPPLPAPALPASAPAPSLPTPTAEQGTASAAQQGAAPSSLEQYSGTDVLAGVRVYTVVGLQVNQSAGEDGMVQFTPVFLSPNQLRRFWRGMQVVSGSAVMARRRMVRAITQQRMESAAAIIAGGSAIGGGGGSGMGGDEDGGELDEPPEVQQFVQEIGQSMGPLGAGGAPKGIARVAATMACGAVTLAARFLSWAGNASDRLVMSTPLGPRLLGIPSEATIEEHTLSELLSSYRAYNSQQAKRLGAPGLPAAATTLPALPLGGGDSGGTALAAPGIAESLSTPAAPAAPAAGLQRPASGEAEAIDPPAQPAQSSAPAGSSVSDAPSTPAAAATVAAAAPDAEGGPAIGAAPAGQAGIAAATPSAWPGTAAVASPVAPAEQHRSTDTPQPGVSAPSTSASPAAHPLSSGTTEGAAAGAQRVAAPAPVGSSSGINEPSAGASRKGGAEGAEVVYRKQLAAAALWLAVTGKLSLDSRSLLSQLLKPTGSQGTRIEAPMDGLEGLQGSLGGPGADDERSASLAVLSKVLPTLEHNGLAPLLVPGAGAGRGAGGWGAVQGQAQGEGQLQQGGPEGAPSLEEEIIRHASPDLALQIVHGKGLQSSMLPQLTRPMGKGLILVGDLDLARQWGIGPAGRPSDRKLLLGVDDGARLLPC